MTELCTEGLRGLSTMWQAEENTQRMGEDQVLSLSLESLRCLQLDAPVKPFGMEIKDNGIAIGN